MKILDNQTKNEVFMVGMEVDFEGDGEVVEVDLSLTFSSGSNWSCCFLVCLKGLMIVEIFEDFVFALDFAKL